ncbi:MAG: prolyl oligopeptidase family serine peptidase, partial [Acidobacteriota bacterium]|nr:prolyl oligopeptidase family serine peptidase [Acidobacteriota bacterium]
IRMAPVLFCTLLAAVLSVAVGAQSKQPPAPSDYGQWETLAAQSRGGLSPDGRWLVYGINRSNRENELRITKIADGTTMTASLASQPVFSADSKWIAYAIGYSETQEEKLRKQKKPVQRKLGIMKLTSGETATGDVSTDRVTTIEGVESFAFDAAGTHLALRRYPIERKEPPAPAPTPAPAPAPAPADDGSPAPGATLIVRELATGRDTTFGNVAEFAWQDQGPLLAFTINADEKIGNGVHLFNPSTSALRVLDSAAAGYVGLSWRKDADDLVVLRATTDERHDGATHAVIAWTPVSAAEPARHVYEPSADRSFPAGMRTVAFRKPSWSDEGDIVFLGMARWNDKPAKDKARKDDTSEAADDEEEPAAVDVWHARDVEVIPRQKISASNDRRRNMLAAWHVSTGAFVPLGKDLFEQVTPIKRQKLAYVASWPAYAMDRSIGRAAADLALVDLTTGARTKLIDRIDDGYVQASPGGRYLLFLNADHFWTIDTRSRAITNITKTVQTSFVNRESDATIKQKPTFGVAGWTKGDEAVILYDKFDIWQVASDGSRATRLTDGAAEKVRHRYVRLNPDDEWIDVEKPVAVSLFGIWTKRSGYGWLNAASTSVEHRVWLDKSVTGLGRAKSADVYSYIAQSFEDSPDIFVGGPDLSSAKAVTATNPFQAKFAWGRAELVEYKSERGERLQGALYYPAGYSPGKKYPMIVYLYERLSDGLHRYVAPSERDYYNTGVFTSQGYVVLQPDIVFRPREPGVSVVECVGPAVKKIVSMGVADATHVGVVGHSWGGFDTAYLTTHTDIFAAGVAGAPITDLVSNYGNHHWSSGTAETDHIETGQQRMEVPLYEDLQAYIRNSAVFNVQNMKTPLLIEVGDGDGTVFWHQGIELYNIARRAKKDVVLLAYAGEDHGLRKKANQIDYQHRILQWFGHYLRNEPAPAWITSGVSVLEREQELKRASKKGS